MTTELINPDFVAFGSNRAPTKNEPAEQSAIGCFLHDESVIADALAVAPAKCWRSKFGFIAQEFERRLSSGEPLDGNLIIAALTGDYPHVDALSSEAFSSVPHGGSAKHFAKLIAQSHQRYTAIHLAGDFATEVGTQCDLEATIANHVQELQRITEGHAAEDAVGSPEGVAGVLAKWESPRSRGLPTGFTGLDKMIGGWQRGRLYVIAASTGVGKSAFAGNSSWHVAKTDDVLFCSLEMPTVEVFERGLSSELRISASEMRNHVLSGNGIEELSASMNLLSQRRLSVDDRTGRNIAQIASQVRRHKRKHGLDLLVVDYLQLVSPTDRRMPRHEQIGEISRGLKLLAKSLDIPVVALSQLSRAGSTDNVRPQLWHLKESSSIEQDADVVMFIHKQKDSSSAELIVAKNRSGRVGDVSLVWSSEFVRFDDTNNDFDANTAFGP